jgi:hypothetical protein
MTSILLFLAAVAHAEAPRVGSGALRAEVGGGVSELGGAAHLGAQTEIWAFRRLGFGLRGATGVDGLTEGRAFVLGEALLPLRPIGGEELSLVLVPGAGAAWHSDYLTTVSATREVASLDAETVPRGYEPTGSLAALIYGQMGFISLSLGPRIETIGYDTWSGTANIGLGVGW